MTEGIKRHMPVVAIVSALGIAAGAFALSAALDKAPDMGLEAFSFAIIAIPCALMVACSLVVMMTAEEIGRALFIIVMGICFAAGVISMVVTSMWMSDPAVASALLANAPSGASVTPPAESPLVVIRNLAAYVVCPTVGSIAGAWIGSRLHPMKSQSRNAKGRRR